MKNLIAYGLDKTIKDFVKTGKPVMGICLGMQLLMESSDEFQQTQGLGLIEGRVEKLPEYPGISLPNTGWEEITKPAKDRWCNTILDDIEEHTDVLFCHSFAAVPTNELDVLCLSRYGDKSICAAVKRENVVGFQFHPEQSGDSGLYLLRKFLGATSV